MTKKERIQTILQHKKPDRLPAQSNFTASMRKTIADHLGISPDDVDKRFDNHLLRVDLSHTKELSSDGSTAYDWWGAGFDTSEEGYLISDYPLAEKADLAAFSRPDPDAPGLLHDAGELIRAENNQEDPRFIIPNFGFALFERAWSLRGMEQFMMDMVF